MKRSVKASELNRLPSSEQEAVLRDLVEVVRSKPNGELKDLDSRIVAYEVKHGMSSEQLRRELSQGRMKESWEICQWLMLLDQRDLLGARKAQAH